MTAMQECIDTYGPLIWSLARRFSGDSTEAEDAVQEIFLVLWQNAARFDPEKGAETTFVAMIARRRLIDRRRSQDREHRRLETLKQRAAESLTLPSDHTSVSEEAQRARQALEQLSSDQQQVLQLAIHGGYTHQEISQITEIPLGTVKTHARRGLIRVREVLAEREQQAREASGIGS
ncbi:MAG: sigma-70 family RNA polymerase sigma factor [Planctomycetes bacterium]|nr:sigma-70 family RNA polymerase sigma factor [Planctomycetota bacterium]NOG54432.1 sigma-70 family RNA polymerase sigma factor [Planctomycetota bacterium]